MNNNLILSELKIINPILLITDIWSNMETRIITNCWIKSSLYMDVGLDSDNFFEENTDELTDKTEFSAFLEVL